MQQKPKKKVVYFAVFSTVMIVILVSTFFILQLMGVDKTYRAVPLYAEEQDFDYDNQPFIGDPDAPIRIVEFGDFKCPACQAWEQLIYPHLKKDYIDTGLAKLYFINFPFIAQDSNNAAAVGEAVFHQNPEAFWEYYELIFDHQQDESTEWATPEFLIKLVEENIEGIDIDKMVSELQTGAYDEDVQNDYNIAGKYKIPGTPSIFINGKAVDDNSKWAYSKFEALIKDDLKQAEVQE